MLRIIKVRDNPKKNWQQPNRIRRLLKAMLKTIEDRDNPEIEKTGNKIAQEITESIL